MRGVTSEQGSGIDLEEEVLVIAVALEEALDTVVGDGKENLAVEEREPLGDGNADEAGLHFGLGRGVLIAERDAMEVLDAEASLAEAALPLLWREAVEICERGAAVQAVLLDGRQVRSEGKVEDLGKAPAKFLREHYRPRSSRYFSTSRAAMQPEPAAVMAWRYLRSLMSPAQKTPGMILPLRVQWTSSVGEDVAVFVEVHHALEGLGVGNVADAEEHEGDGQGVFHAGGGVLEAQALDVLFLDAEDLLDDGVGAELDLRVRLGALEHDGAGAELFRAVDEGDLGGEAGEEEGFFHGGVAAADDGDLLAGGEEAVAGGAGGDAVADEGLLGGQVEPAGGSAGGDDEGAGVDGFRAEIELDRLAGFGGELGGGRWAMRSSAPKRVACFFMFSMSSGPWMPSGQPGKFSTRVVMESWPPGSWPSSTRGLRLERPA